MLSFALQDAHLPHAGPSKMDLLLHTWHMCLSHPRQKTRDCPLTRRVQPISQQTIALGVGIFTFFFLMVYIMRRFKPGARTRARRASKARRASRARRTKARRTKARRTKTRQVGGSSLGEALFSAAFSKSGPPFGLSPDSAAAKACPAGGCSAEFYCKHQDGAGAAVKGGVTAGERCASAAAFLGQGEK